MSTNRRWRRCVPLLLGAVGVVMFTATASAAGQTREVSKPIQTLKDRINKHKRTASDTSLPSEQRARAAEQVLGAYRELIRAHPDHPMRMVWKTDFVGYILRVVLPEFRNRAGLFVAFGLPVPAQEAAFQALVKEAYKRIREARVDWLTVQSELPKRQSFETKYVNTGRWKKLREEYGSLKLPLYLAWTNLYAHIGEIGQGHRLVVARTAIRRVNLEGVAPRATALTHSLLGRILLRQRPGKEATRKAAKKALGKATSGKNPGLSVALATQLARGWLMHRAGRSEAAIRFARKLRNASPYKNAVFALILLTDLEFRVRMAQAEQLSGSERKKAERKAYALYEEDLLKHPTIAKRREAIEAFLNKRFAGDPSEVAPEEDAPTRVIAACRQLLKQSEEGSSEEKAAEKRARQAVGYLESLLERKGLASDKEREAAFLLATAKYEAGDAANAARRFLELAKAHKGKPVGAQAIANGVRIAGGVWEANRDSEAARKLAGDALSLLFDRYPDHSLTRKHRYTLGTWHRAGDAYEKAIEAYKEVGPDDPYYLDSLYEKLVCRFRLWEDASKEARKAAYAKKVVADAKAAREALRSAAGEEERRNRQLGDTTLKMAEVLVETLGRLDRAMELLSGFEKRHRGMAGLLRRALALEVRLLVKRGQAKEAVGRVQRFVRRFPEKGGRMLTQVLDRVKKQAASLPDDSSQRQALTKVAVQLGKYLLEWAKRQPFGDEPTKLLPYQIAYGKQLVAAGQTKQARKLYKRLLNSEAGKQHQGVLNGAAEAYYRAGKLKRARELYRKIVKGTEPDSDVFWNAWRRVLSISDTFWQRARQAGDQQKADRLSGEIYRRIQQLKLHDKELGGDPYQETFSRLEVKHAP